MVEIETGDKPKRSVERILSGTHSIVHTRLVADSVLSMQWKEQLLTRCNSLVPLSLKDKYFLLVIEENGWRNHIRKRGNFSSLSKSPSRLRNFLHSSQAASL